MQYIKYLQTPFKHGGYDFTGADCYGILYLFYKNELGIELTLPDFTYDEKWWVDHNYFLDLYKEFSFKKQKSEYKLGDVILFSNITGVPGHIGIILDDSNFLHMSSNGGGISTYTFGVWARQIHSVYRYVKRRQSKCS